jgi:acyl-CoA thioester hydrolase
VPRVSESRFRVRYAETDQMGVAHHSAHVTWLEAGRTDFCRELGFSYGEMENEGFGLAVVEVLCRYRAPARFEDELAVQTWLCDLREKRLSFGYRVLRPSDATLVADGQTLHICITRDGRPAPIPERYRKLLAGAM